MGPFLCHSWPVHGLQVVPFLPFLPSPLRQDTHRTLDVLSPQGETLDVLCLAYAIPRFGIRGLGSGNGGFGKSDKFLRGLPHFAGEARKHWPGWRPANPRGAADSRLTRGGDGAQPCRGRFWSSPHGAVDETKGMAYE